MGRAQILLLITVSVFAVAGVTALLLREPQLPGSPAVVEPRPEPEPVTPEPLQRELPVMAPATLALFGGVQTRLDADAWIRSVWEACYLGRAAEAVQRRPPPTTDHGDMYEAACFALSGDIGRARRIIDGLPENLRPEGASVVFSVARPAADAGDYAVAGAPMELVLEYGPTHAVAMFHAGAARLAAGDSAGARSFLTTFLEQDGVPERWRAAGRDVLSRAEAR